MLFIWRREEVQAKKFITITTYPFHNQKPNTELEGNALNMKCSQSLKWILLRTIIMNISGKTLVSNWCLCSKWCTFSRFPLMQGFDLPTNYPLQPLGVHKWDCGVCVCVCVVNEEFKQPNLARATWRWVRVHTPVGHSLITAHSLTSHRHTHTLGWELWRPSTEHCSDVTSFQLYNKRVFTQTTPVSWCRSSTVKPSGWCVAGATAPGTDLIYIYKLIHAEVGRSQGLHDHIPAFILMRREESNMRWTSEGASGRL